MYVVSEFGALHLERRCTTAYLPEDALNMAMRGGVAGNVSDSLARPLQGGMKGSK